MTSLQSLLTLYEHASRQRDLALQGAQQAESAVTAAAAQTEQLLAYRGDYERRYQGQFQQGGQGGAIQLVMHYQSFMTRLQEAIEQQRRTHQLMTLQRDKALVVLRQLELRVASTHKLIERRRVALQGLAERRDQKLTDELAMRAAWTQRRDGSTVY